MFCMDVVVVCRCVPSIDVFLCGCSCSCIDASVSFFLVSWDGVRLSPLGTSATNSPTVPAPRDKWWWWMWSTRWNENWQGKLKYSEKICPSATLSTTNPTWPDLGANPGPRGGKTATNRLSYGTAMHVLSLPDCVLSLFLFLVFRRSHPKILVG
jgi:hypothetical protein